MIADTLPLSPLTSERVVNAYIYRIGVRKGEGKEIDRKHPLKTETPNAVGLKYE